MIEQLIQKESSTHKFENASMKLKMKETFRFDRMKICKKVTAENASNAGQFLLCDCLLFKTNVKFSRLCVSGSLGIWAFEPLGVWVFESLG